MDRAASSDGSFRSADPPGATRSQDVASAIQKSRVASIAAITAYDLLARVGEQLEDADQHAVVAQQVLVGDALRNGTICSR